MRAALTERLKSFGPARRLATLVGAESRQARASATAGLVSIGLRAAFLIIKFAFIVALARFTDPATVGIYALLVTISTVAVYGIGLEIHTFTGREIVADTDGRGALHIQSHLRTVTAIFFVAVPVVWGFSTWLGLGGKYSFPLFAVIVYLETLGQELGRYLLMLSRPVASSVLQFIRGAVWMPIPIVPLLWARDHAGIIDVILWCWLAGGVLAVGYGFSCIRRFLTPRHAFRLDWLAQAFTSARHYFVVALLSQVQFYSDRFVVQRVMGESDVGVLSFYQNFAGTMVAFVQTGVVSVMLPRLLVAAKNRDVTGEAAVRRSMLTWALALAVGISVCLAVGMPFLLGQMNKSIYLSAMPVFFVLLAGNVILIVGIVMHLSLYARRMDAQLMRVSLVVVPTGLLVNILTVPRFGLYGAAVVFCIVSTIDLLAKGWVLRRSLRGLPPADGRDIPDHVS